MAETETTRAERDRWPIWLGVGLIAVLLLVVVVVVWSSGVFTSDKEVRVPDVVDLSQQEAREKLKDARLDVERWTARTRSASPRGP